MDAFCNTWKCFEHFDAFFNTWKCFAPLDAFFNTWKCFAPLDAFFNTWKCFAHLWFLKCMKWWLKCPFSISSWLSLFGPIHAQILFQRAQNSLTPKNKSNYTIFSSENTLETIHLRKKNLIPDVVKVLRKLSAAIAHSLAPAD
jgi:hypothetical protein